MFRHPQTPGNRLPSRRCLSFLLVLLVGSYASVLADETPVASAAKPSASKPAQRTAKVAGIVLKWIRQDKAANLRRAEPLIRKAAAAGAEIVCTTECFLDGYAIADKSIPLDQYRALGEAIPDGPYFRKLSALADDLNINLVAGMLEADGELRYNTAVWIGADGKLLGKYRKQKLQHETVRNTPGKDSPVFDTPFGKVSLMICADRTDPRLVSELCSTGADFLICPSGGMFGPTENDPIVQGRSVENGIYIVFVHPAEFLVTGPDGKIRLRELVGDRVLIDPAEEGGPGDEPAVFYYDLPLGARVLDD